MCTQNNKQKEEKIIFSFCSFPSFFLYANTYQFCCVTSPTKTRNSVPLSWSSSLLSSSPFVSPKVDFDDEACVGSLALRLYLFFGFRSGKFGFFRKKWRRSCRNVRAVFFQKKIATKGKKDIIYLRGFTVFGETLVKNTFCTLRVRVPCLVLYCTLL